MKESKINWQQDAITKLNNAPFFIRSYARKKVEKAATAKGIDTITVEFMEQVRKENMA